MYMLLHEILANTVCNNIALEVQDEKQLKQEQHMQTQVDVKCRNQQRASTVGATKTNNVAQSRACSTAADGRMQTVCGRQFATDSLRLNCHKEVSASFCSANYAKRVRHEATVLWLPTTWCDTVAETKCRPFELST
jgi:hypothetical protein